MSDSTHQSTLFDPTGKTVTVWADASCPSNGEPDVTAGYGCVIKDEDSGEVEEIQGLVEYDDDLTEPAAEYKAIIAGTELVCNEYSEVGVFQVYNDVEAVVEQINDDYNVDSIQLQDLKKEAYRLLPEFDQWHVDWQSKEQSSELQRANELAKDAVRGSAQ
jgi:ribonuclease HI